MGDVGDTFRAARDQKVGESKRRRRRYREHAPKVLEAAGLAFASKNGGAHLIVKKAGRVAKPDCETWVDFWPGTGLWIVRLRGDIKSKQSRGRGIFNLLQFLELDAGDLLKEKIQF